MRFFSKKRFSKLGQRFFAFFLCVTILSPQILVPVLAQEVDTNPVESPSGAMVPRVAHTPLFAILVEDQLYRHPEIKTRIAQYAEDAQKDLELQALVIPVEKTASVLEIYELLAQLYFSGKRSDGLSRLQGMVIVGDLPIPVVEKDKNFWPTIFPYVDFVNPAYLWDTKKERFVFSKAYEMEPEIWHGVIRAGVDDFDLGVAQLSRYFDANHKIHAEEDGFSKKVFFANFERQKEVISEELFAKYTQWIKYLEPIQYLRFTKHFLKQLQIEDRAAGYTTGFSSWSADEQAELLASMKEAYPDLTKEELIDLFDNDYEPGSPDVLTPYVIDGMVKRYSQIYSNFLEDVAEKVEKSGRWEITETDTTPMLVAQKDEESVLRLRYFNDLIEKETIKLVKENKVPSDISVTTTQTISYQFPWCYTHTETNPLYWNGVNRQGDFDVEDCTNIRGSERSASRPFAQQVEAINTYNLTGNTQCLPSDTDIRVRRDDKYEGVCVVNQEEKNRRLTYNYGATMSQWAVSPTIHNWLRETFCTATGGKISDEMEQKCFKKGVGSGKEFNCCPDCSPDSSCLITIGIDYNEGCNWYCPIDLSDPECMKLFTPIHHYGAEKPVLSLEGTEEWDQRNEPPSVGNFSSEWNGTTEGVTPADLKIWNKAEGAEGCRPMVSNHNWGFGSKTFSSLMIHDEPRPATIRDQFATQITRALPVDDPRGFSFWDHQKKFHRLDFLNIFAFRGLFKNFEDFKQSVEVALKNKIKEINEISVAGGGLRLFQKNRFRHFFPK